MSSGEIFDGLVADLRRLRWGPPVACVYQPLEYARASFDVYVSRYLRTPCEALFVGMNPGPWGMAQTGIPFGEVDSVRDWMGIETPVGRPRRELPNRPVRGFDCPRREVSGRRFWGWARESFETPERFFRRFFVLNYCPLCFFDSRGGNLTPDKLPAAQREPLFAACDRALLRIMAHLKPTLAIGVGRFAETCLHRLLSDGGPRVGHIPHPSPASPQANVNWPEQVRAEMSRMGVSLPALRGGNRSRDSRAIGGGKFVATREAR